MVFMLLTTVIESHLWIFYLLFFNGFLLSQILSCYIDEYRKITEKFEAKILAGFFISVVLNGLLLWLFFHLNISISFFSIFFPICSIFLFLGTMLGIWQKRPFNLSLSLWANLRFGVYAFVFFILCYNGGLIEQIADSWYHLSLANKIGEFRSLSISNHLNGVAEYSYPTLWHGNLALLNRFSEHSLPLLWNSVTPWIGSFKVMAFYLFAFGLSKSERIAFLSIVLFVLLPGMGDSYLRVSAWPSHVSYTAWFALFYVTFLFFDKLQSSVSCWGNGLNSAFAIGSNIKQHSVYLSILLFLIIFIFFAHRAEIVWYACGLFFYAVMIFCFSIFKNNTMRLEEPAWPLLRLYMSFVFLLIVVISILKLMPILHLQNANPEIFLLVALMLLISSAFLCIELLNLRRLSDSSGIVIKSLLLLLFLLVLLTVDLKQLFSLFQPHLGYPIPRSNDAAVLTTGWLDGVLKLPSWHMQLRSGLLYSSVLAIILSFALVIIRPNRLTLFLSGNAVIPFLILLSPYLYQWLTDALNYHSAWRVSLLIFHPIILACSIFYFWDLAAGKKTVIC